MPALVMSRALFIHVPKTGGHYVQEALERLGIEATLPPSIPRPSFMDHPMLRDLQGYRQATQRRFTFGFVRFPPDWWRSYWAYRMRTGWAPMDSTVKSDDFPTFIENVLELHPGFATKLLEEYVGAPGEIEFVGRYESLTEDLARALEAAGYPVDPGVLSQAKPQNTSDYRVHRAEYPPDLLREMMAAERRGIERWYPERLGEVGRSGAVPAA